MKGEEKRLLGEALLEGLNQRIDKELEDFDEDITPSPEHYKRMEEILGFKIKKPRRKHNWSLGARIAAAIIAAVLVFTGCAVAVFFNEIREAVVDFYETHIRVRYDEGDDSPYVTNIIEEVYELTYIPAGYTKTSETHNKLLVTYKWQNLEGYWLVFKQGAYDSFKSLLDIEEGQYEVITLGIYEINYRKSELSHQYVWNDGKYSLVLNSKSALSESELKAIIDGIKVKE